MDQSRIPQLEPTEQDDPEFVELGSRVLDAMARQYKPKDIFIVQIDHWFGHRWKKFPAGVWSIARGARWFQSMIVPPFHPNRVSSQFHYARIDADELLYGDKEVARLHFPYQPQTKSYPPIHGLTTSGIFVWYSGKAKTTDRASLMAYRIEKDDEAAWYVSFLKQEAWKIELAKGISPQELMRLAPRVAAC